MGKVFSRSELEGIASIVRKHPKLMVISDEVYEFVLFGGSDHVRIATLPGMWERTITVSSVGKTFSCTGRLNVFRVCPPLLFDWLTLIMLHLQQVGRLVGQLHQVRYIFHNNNCSDNHNNIFRDNVNHIQRK